MANLTPTAILDDVYQLEITDPVLAGPGGISNRQAQQLLNRTEWLREAVVNQGLNDGVEFSGDMDSLQTPGFYYIRSGATNKPISQPGMCLVVGRTDTPENGNVPAAAQIWITNNTSRLYVRYLINGAEASGWVEFVNAASYSTFALSFTGAVQAFAMNTPPTGWLECDGSAVSRVTYATLFSKITTLYGAGDGVTTFNLPDLRGEFVRGWDNGRGIDSGRAIATFQADEFRQHNHSDSQRNVNANQSAAGTDTDEVGGITNFTTGLTGGVETRPRNTSMMYCIKY